MTNNIAALIDMKKHRPVRLLSANDWKSLDIITMDNATGAF